ncbi:MAG TPA: hypothetical protein VNW68_00205, partial [Candidatus Limnocylindria bacterium]|nr:hypothetical protein [Candidatus Limnocylindria bacterium]
RVAGLLLAGLLLFIGTGCDLGLPQIGAECAGRADAPLCQAALDAAMPQLAPYMGERHTLRVGPVDCSANACSASVTALPPADECLPTWEAYMTAPRDGAWQAEWVVHGDPACAFEE